METLLFNSRSFVFFIILSLNRHLFIYLCIKFTFILFIYLFSSFLFFLEKTNIGWKGAFKHLNFLNRTFWRGCRKTSLFVHPHPRVWRAHPIPLGMCPHVILIMFGGGRKVFIMNFLFLAISKKKLIISFPSLSERLFSEVTWYFFTLESHLFRCS